MKAIVYEKYGEAEVLKIEEVKKPNPKNDEVLIQIFATSCHIGDVRMRSLNVPGPKINKILARLALGITKPRNPILGMEFSGRVEAIGKETKNFKVGDEVFASTSWSGFGAYAEYICLNEDSVLSKKPKNIKFEEAAILPGGGITSLWLMEQAAIKDKEKVLIYGASGSIGSFITQLVKSNGAEVTSVCSRKNFDLVKSLGADHQIDYTKNEDIENLEKFDCVLDCVGYFPKKKAKKFLFKDGRYIGIHSASNGLKKEHALQLLQELCLLVESKTIRPVLDRTYTFEEIVEAHKYVEQNHKKGNVAIKV